jgi:hypothetical protein
VLRGVNRRVLDPSKVLDRQAGDLQYTPQIDKDRPYCVTNLLLKGVLKHSSLLHFSPIDVPGRHIERQTAIAVLAVPIVRDRRPGTARRYACT